MPDEPWVKVMKEIFYSEDDKVTDDFFHSLVDKDSTGDEYFVVLSSYLIRNKTDVPIEQFADIIKDIAAKSPFFYNKIGEKEIKEYEKNPGGRQELLKSALLNFKKANDAGFLTARNARMIIGEDIIHAIDIDKIFTKEEQEQLKRLGASTPSENDEVEVVEMTPPEEAVELIED